MHENQPSSSSRTVSGKPSKTPGHPRVEILTGASPDGADPYCQRLREESHGQRGNYDPRWLEVVCRGLQHKPYLLVARSDERTVGILPLAFVKSLLFGRFLVSLPYVNTAGVIALSSEAAYALVDRPVATAILIHGCRMTEVPSASSLRQFNATNANMLMYWHLLQRAIERSQQGFDFGRSSADSSTYRFKKQWGAKPEPTVWQYYVRNGNPGDMRPENSKYARAVRIWQKLPVPLTRLIGPLIVRGIP
jgi:hypothetical protein